MNQSYDCVVIGGGHAGIEAVYAASILLGRVALVTLAETNIGQMSCNPSIGGIGKGIIVREVDALGGIMGRITDEATIHSKVLNETKGPAVWGPRAQTDRDLYHNSATKILKEMGNLDIIIGSVEDIELSGNEVRAVLLEDGRRLQTKAIVLTTGTFLSGMILLGKERIPAGRVNEKASYGLSKTLSRFGFELGRLKTGTPPRLFRDTIDFSALEVQEGDIPPKPFSYVNASVDVPQTTCYITYTNPEAHDVLFANQELSPIYTKEIEAKGPRYCPSIEDKTIRFPQNPAHRIFLEIEGLNSNLVYPAGISTAMPLVVQQQFINKIKGLESAKIAQAGYAIEYDYINPQELLPTLETKKVKNLSFAGQINGTTGYEEAAGQGIVAGINAAMNVLNNPPFILSRTESYIGVMINDLTTKGITEPYRMFTSRQEYRISVRADNADFRLTPHAIELGTACNKRTEIFLTKKKKYDELTALLQSETFTPNDLSTNGIEISKDGVRRNGIELLAHPLVQKEDVVRLFPTMQTFSDEIVQCVEITAKYLPYLERQFQDAKIIQEREKVLIPQGINFREMKSLSNEVIEKLEKVRPHSLADAMNIEGITPSAIIAISLFLRNYKTV
ncbi:MAG: tRNA uridine-5-carboxymethylaminomethyl(34) synthesis enzyme MnmG [Proteobacteria bacterium]|nr:tRNA uridine-5-carboxymethylaminomethyl(34) synthesis enzyme MnmG [Pseudomonadota bacterium]